LLKKNAATNNWQRAILALGVTLCLMGALLMFHGSILGERTTGIATVVGITGISIICIHGNKRTKR
jgi:hypothetical protein